MAAVRVNLSALRWAAALVAAVLVAFPAQLASAQETARTEFGDWQLRCDTLPDGDGEQCAMIQRVAAQDRGDVWLNAVLYRPPEDDNTLILSVLVPLQVILTRRIGVRIDGAEDVTWFDFRSCSIEGCVAPIELDDSLRRLLRDSGEALFILFFEDDVGVGVPVSLIGFSGAMDALP